MIHSKQAGHAPCEIWIRASACCCAIGLAANSPITDDWCLILRLNVWIEDLLPVGRQPPAKRDTKGNTGANSHFSRPLRAIYAGPPPSEDASSGGAGGNTTDHEDDGCFSRSAQHDEAQIAPAWTPPRHIVTSSLKSAWSEDVRRTEAVYADTPPVRAGTSTRGQVRGVAPPRRARTRRS